MAVDQWKEEEAAASGAALLQAFFVFAFEGGVDPLSIVAVWRCMD